MLRKRGRKKVRFSYFGMMFILFVSILSYNAISLQSTETISIIGDEVYVDYLITNINGRINLTLPSESSIEYLKSDEGPVEYDIEMKEDSKIIHVKENVSILIAKIKTNELLSYSEGAKILYYKAPFNDSKVIFNIPDIEKDIIEIYPDAEYKYMGGSPVLIFRNSNIIIIKMRYKKYNYYYVIALLFIIAGYFAYKRYKYRKIASKARILNEYEKMIIELLIKKKSIPQYEIMRETNLNKSHLSKILKKMEFRGIIKRRKKGKVNIIEIGDKI